MMELSAASSILLSTSLRMVYISRNDESVCMHNNRNGIPHNYIHSVIFRKNSLIFVYNYIESTSYMNNIFKYNCKIHRKG